MGEFEQETIAFAYFLLNSVTVKITICLDFVQLKS